MKVYVLKKVANFGEFEDPVKNYATDFVFSKKEDGERLAEKLNDTFPDCKGTWSLPFYVEELEVIEDYSVVPELLKCSWCKGIDPKCLQCGGKGIKYPIY